MVPFLSDTINVVDKTGNKKINSYLITSILQRFPSDATLIKNLTIKSFYPENFLMINCDFCTKYC